MATQTTETPVQRPAADLKARFPGRHIDMTSFKRDDTGVPTPPDAYIDDGSHTPAHGDALVPHQSHVRH